MTTPRIEKDHIVPYRNEFAKRPTQCWKRLPSCEYRQHRRARRRAAKEELRNILQRENEMTKKINKFDALAYSISVLGQPHETYKNRFAEESHGLVADAHLWALPSGWQLVVHEWSDGDQSTNGREGMTDLGGALRDNADGSLCPAYEEHARWLIDAYAEAVR